MENKKRLFKTENGAVKRFFANKIAVISLIVFVIIVLACITAPIVTPYSYHEMDVNARFERPDAAHIFGCDYMGRDLYTRIVYGGRVTLKIAAVATILSCFLGLVLGLVSGYIGGTVDLVIMRVMEILSSVPTLLLVILAECLMGWGTGNFRFALALAGLPSFVRLTRSNVNQVMSRPYIEAARALGVKGPRMVIKHIIPNILPSLFVHISGNFAEQLLTCTIMGYVGIGVNPPTPEWGTLVADGYAYIRSATYTAVIPAAVVAACVLSVNLIGNGLRDAIDGGDRNDG